MKSVQGSGFRVHVPPAAEEHFPGLRAIVQRAFDEWAASIGLAQIVETSMIDGEAFVTLGGNLDRVQNEGEL